MRKLAPCVLALAAACAAPPALSQAYPTKPIRTIATVSGGVEVAIRVLSNKMAEALGQPIVVEAQSGAGGAVGATAVARSAPDGYTLAYATTSAMVMRPFLTRNTPYDTIKDFTPITQVGEAVACVVVNNSVPANNLKELIEYARANPGKVSYGSSGVGTTHHLSGELLADMTGIRIVHVPYKSGGQAFQDLYAGQIQLLFGVMASTLPQIEAGKVRLIAINGDKRYSRTPNVPTVAEVLPGYDRPPGWMAYFGPAGLPQPITRRLYIEIGKGMGTPDVIAIFEKLGLQIEVSASPEQFAEEVKKQYAKAGALVKAAGITPE
jgi:tripartite-type tricarboxylate transporter receptor subunit TctC